jgi:DNA-binding PadR family transcriptional regulator
MKGRSVSELEGCVLGVIGLEEPVTAYAVAMVFVKSPSPQWSGSAGAIYPLVQRLQRGKLVRATKHAVGLRGRSLLSLTPAGRMAFQRWLGPPVSARVGGVPPDSLRTRIRFLGLVSARKQASFLEMARRSAERSLLVVRADCTYWKMRGGFRYLIARGALMSMEARCRWLREVQRAVTPGRRTGKSHRRVSQGAIRTSNAVKASGGRR